jgi:hypothetical protein
LRSITNFDISQRTKHNIKLWQYKRDTQNHIDFNIIFHKNDIDMIVTHTNMKSGKIDKLFMLLNTKDCYAVFEVCLQKLLRLNSRFYVNICNLILSQNASPIIIKEHARFKNCWKEYCEKYYDRDSWNWECRKFD